MTALFSPHLIWIDENNDRKTLRRPLLFGQTLYVIPRHLCGFRQVGLRGSNATAIKALKFQLERESLKPDQQFRIDRNLWDQSARVWSFPKNYARLGWSIPETLLFEPQQEGTRIVACHYGFEGQVWHRGELTASRWWQDIPSIEAWEVFLKSAPSPLENILRPETQSVAYRNNLPIMDTSLEGAYRLFSPERLACTVAAMGFAGVVFFGVQEARYMSLNKGYQQGISVVGPEAQAILSKKRRAMKSLALPRALSDQGDPAALVITVQAIAHTLKGRGLVLVSVNAVEDNLRMVFQPVANLNGPKIVSDLEALPILRDVTIRFDSLGRLNLDAEFDAQKTATIKAIIGDKIIEQAAKE